MKMTKQQGIKLVAAFVLLAVAVVMLGKNLGVRGGASAFYYYDLGSGELFSASPAMPPIKAASGEGKGVLAHVAGCGNCDKKNLIVLSLETYTPEAKAAKQSGITDAATFDKVEAGHMIAAVPPKGEQPQWFPKRDPRSIALAQSVPSCPGGAASILCQP